MTNITERDTPAFFFGGCKLCMECEYKGSMDTECCNHQLLNHTLLQFCNECPCDAFCSNEFTPRCSECGHHCSSHCSGVSLEEEIIQEWVLRGMTQNEMTREYKNVFIKRICRATLRGKLAAMGLARDKVYSDEKLLEAIKVEISLGIVKYPRLHKALRVKHKLFVSRDRLRQLLKYERLLSAQKHLVRARCNGTPSLNLNNSASADRFSYSTETHKELNGLVSDLPVQALSTEDRSDRWSSIGKTLNRVLINSSCLFEPPPSMRSLRNKRLTMGIKCGRSCSDDEVLEAINLEYTLGVMEYERLYQALYIKHDINMSRNKLRDLLIIQRDDRTLSDR